MSDRTNGFGSSVRILFLGQCLQYGYATVNKPSTFAHLVASSLRVRFPELNFRFDLKYLYHPRGLKAILAHRSVFAPPDAAVINLPAMFAATTWRVNVVYEMAPELVDTARSFMQKVEAKLKGNAGPPEARTVLDRAFALRPPIPISEYERLIEEAVEACRRTSKCRLVLMGPGGFNEGSIEDYAVHSPELWSSVNQMVLRVGQRLNIPVVNVQEALGEQGSKVFIPKNHRWSQLGHEIVAREVEAALALQIAELIHKH